MDLKHSIRTEPVTHIDLSFYVEAEKGTNIRDVVIKMQASHRKCALIMDRGKLVGIFTERDIVEKVAGVPESGDALIEEMMTASPVTIDADQTILEATQVIAANPFRYMPVVDGEGKVLGTLTYYAIIKYISDFFPQEIYNLPPDPDLIARERAGA